MRQPISSNKRVYEIGKRGAYVYHLVQRTTDPDERRSQIDELTAIYDLTEGEIDDLTGMLVALDARRSSKAIQSTPDPYWSLWGRIKARERRWQRAEGLRIEADEIDGFVGDGLHHAADEIEESCGDSLTLPHRGVSVSADLDNKTMTIGVVVKKYRNDQHAVNTLRKLDLDDEYFAVMTE